MIIPGKIGRDPKKLPKQFKKRWIAALRSGKYTQGVGRLGQSNNGKYLHCCLGVACEIVGVPRQVISRNNMIMSSTLLNNSEIPVILKSVENAKVTLPTKRGNIYTVCDKLAKMNDSGKSFERIANYIEKNL